MALSRTLNDTINNASREFTPLNWNMAEVRGSVPARLFERNTILALFYLTRDVAMATAAWKYASYIDSKLTDTPSLQMLAWVPYWWIQGLVFTGLWVIGHECGHDAFSRYRSLNNIVGFLTHTFLLTPYFSWRISHHRHHSNHNSISHDEVYLPQTRSDVGLPANPSPLDFEELFSDTPIYTLFKLVLQQLFAFPAYLMFNVSGQKSYPKWTNHFSLNSVLFSKSHRLVVMISNAGMVSMLSLLWLASNRWGFIQIVKFYLIPYFEVSCFFTAITYLNHTSPEIPHYRGTAWSFQRGAAATIDRDFLGWQGRFFFHGVAHFHVVHHFFPRMPFYHGEEATKHLRQFLGEHYMTSDEPALSALWNTYNSCIYVDDEDEVMFYRDKRGRAIRRCAATSVSE